MKAVLKEPAYKDEEAELEKDKDEEAVLKELVEQDKDFLTEDEQMVLKKPWEKGDKDEDKMPTEDQDDNEPEEVLMEPLAIEEVATQRSPWIGCNKNIL